MDEDELKRYAITIVIQREVIVYGYDEESAKMVALKAYPKAKCISIQEIPLPEDEVHESIIDNRKAPGS